MNKGSAVAFIILGILGLAYSCDAGCENPASFIGEHALRILVLFCIFAAIALIFRKAKREEDKIDSEDIDES